MPPCALPFQAPSASGTNTSYDVVHIGVISSAAAISKNGKLRSAFNQRGEFVNGQVWALPWSIDRKKAEAGNADAIKMGIGITKILGCQLGCRIRRNGAQEVVVFSKRCRRTFSVDRT